MNFLNNPCPVEGVNGKHAGERTAPKWEKTHLRTSAYLVLTLMLAALMVLGLAPAASATHTPRQVIGWGYDFHNEVTNIPPDVDFVAIAAGATHSLALRSDGSIAAWGQIYGTPKGHDFIAIACGSNHSLALRSDGSIVSWGWDGHKQVSDTPTGNDFVAITAGWAHSLALRSNGTIVAWGDDHFQQVSGVPAGRKCVAIASGLWHSLALALDLWSDISDETWVNTYKITADQAYRVAQGYDDGSFRPANQIVRQQFNSMIARILVQRELEYAGAIRGQGGATYLTLAQWYAAEGEEYLMDFADRGQLTPPHLETTAFLIFKGVVQGSEEQGLRYLRPNQNLTRVQGVVMTVRAHGTLSG